MDKAKQTINKTKEDYEAVKEFYVEKFNLDPELVDLNSNYVILLMCASGASNESISKFLDIPEHSIELVLNEVFGFEGREKDLDSNPYKVYCNGGTVYGDVLDMCETMKRVEDRIKNEWV